MSRFSITYIVEAESLDAAAKFGHELLFIADKDVEEVSVRHAEHPAGRTFAQKSDAAVSQKPVGDSGGRIVTSNQPIDLDKVQVEFDPRVYERVMGRFEIGDKVIIDSVISQKLLKDGDVIS